MSPCISHRLRHITYPSLLGSLVLFAFCDHFCSEKKINQMCFYKVIEAFFYHFFFISSGFFSQTSSDQFVLQPQVKTVGLIHEKISWRNIKIKDCIVFEKDHWSVHELISYYWLNTACYDPPSFFKSLSHMMQHTNKPKVACSAPAVWDKNKLFGFVFAYMLISF